MLELLASGLPGIGLVLAEVSEIEPGMTWTGCYRHVPAPAANPFSS